MLRGIGYLSGDWLSCGGSVIFLVMERPICQKSRHLRLPADTNPRRSLIQNMHRMARSLGMIIAPRTQTQRSGEQLSIAANAGDQLSEVQLDGTVSCISKGIAAFCPPSSTSSIRPSLMECLIALVLEATETASDHPKNSVCG